MCFNNDVIENALVASGRYCCICNKFCGVNIETHHIRAKAKGGDDSLDNCIPLCFDCHAEVGHYNKLHPKGRKYSEGELRKHRDNWFEHIKNKDILNKSNGLSQNIQTITGNNNLQASGNIEKVIISSNKTPNIQILPPNGSIGSDGLLKETISEKFYKLGDERKKRFGNNAFPVMYNNFKKDFGIKDNKWTVIWSWPKSCGRIIIEYLDKKYSNTIQGRIEKAGKREDYIHTRPHLYRLEKEYIEHLGLSEEYVKTQLANSYYVSSHSQLTHLQHWLWVKTLEYYVELRHGN